MMIMNEYLSEISKLSNKINDDIEFVQITMLCTVKIIDGDNDIDNEYIDKLADDIIELSKISKFPLYHVIADILTNYNQREIKS